MSMTLEVIDAQTVRARLPMRECIEAMVPAMIAAHTKTAAIPPRTIMHLVDGSGYFGVMPGSLREPLVYGTKVVSLHPANPAAGRPAIQGFVALFDPVTGAPAALVDGAEITAMRTAAASALATRLLARPEARSLGMIGCGAQAVSHVQAISLVRDIEEVRVWGRSVEKARAFCERYAEILPGKIRAVRTAEEAAECDVVCTVTGAHEPVIRGDWVQPGAHINLVGAHTRSTREADTALILRSRVFVDSIESAFNEAGDLLIPLEERAIERSHVIAEIGALLVGNVPGRREGSEVTLYKSLGLTVQDLVCAHAVWQRAAQI